MKEVKEIYEQMRAVFASEAGFTPNDGCDAMVRLYALAAQVQALDAQAEWVLEQCFPQTAQGIYLDYHAQTRGITRMEAEKAEGVLRFSCIGASAADYEIDAGSVVMTAAGVRFETTEKAVLAQGESEVDVPAHAVEAGAAGNVIAGAAHIMSVYPIGVTRCSNPEPFSGGSDEEEDEALRERVLESYRSCRTAQMLLFMSWRRCAIRAWRRRRRWGVRAASGRWMCTFRRTAARRRKSCLQAFGKTFRKSGRSPWM